MSGVGGWVFFLDRSLGSHTVAEALRAAGAAVEIHGDHFAKDAADVGWLPVVGERGWVVLTKDGAIRRRPLERAAIIHAKVRFFAFSNANASGRDVANGFVSALPAMLRILERHEPPFAAVVHRTGRVEWRALS